LGETKKMQEKGAGLLEKRNSNHSNRVTAEGEFVGRGTNREGHGVLHKRRARKTFEESLDGRIKP